MPSPRSPAIPPSAVPPLRIASFTTSLGWVLAAWTPQGLCCVLLGDHPDNLLIDLCRRFPHHPVQPAHIADTGLQDAVRHCIEQPHRAYPGPLQPAGTPFQQQVWQVLRQIPAGSSISYRELAERLGRPTAARAVAAACAANPLAVLVPCHRVLDRRGGLAGYRWGVHRKAELLRREGHPAWLGRD